MHLDEVLVMLKEKGVHTDKNVRYSYLHDNFKRNSQEEQETPNRNRQLTIYDIIENDNATRP